MPVLRAGICLLLLVTLTGYGSASSLQYDARLCSAELLVMAGDLRALQDPLTPDHHRRGLRQRLAGALGTLNWLCRRYAAIHDHSPVELASRITALRDDFETRSYRDFERNLEELIGRMPLSLEGLQPQQVSVSAVQTGQQLYRRYCAACHEQPDASRETPAYSLFLMARRQPLQEFIARMLVGVRGKPLISLRNPLSDRDIAGMTAYLLAGGDLDQ